jgi:hypothetical protein
MEEPDNETNQRIAPKYPSKPLDKWTRFFIISMTINEENFLLLERRPSREVIMKKCPFCAEEIQDDAIKCKHCGEFLAAYNSPRFAGAKLPWYFRRTFIIFALCSVGPLALPLIWWRPQTTQAWKIGLTIVILVLSWMLFQSTMESIHTIKGYYKLLEGK